MNKKLKKEAIEADNLREVDLEGVAEEMTFEVFFAILLKEKRVMAHHKPPMRQFAEASGLMSTTRSEFEQLFKSY
jgi:hypothetical protein